MKLKQALEIGLDCGLETIGEAILNINNHSGNLFSYENINKEIDELISDTNNLFSKTNYNNESKINHVLSFINYCTYEECELFTIIPREEIDRVFTKSNTASAEMDFTFLGFEEVYKSILNFVPKNKIIVDLGCGYAAQSYYFTKYKKYIGVDNGIEDNVHFVTENMEYYNMSIQNFCKMITEQNWNLEEIFAICSYVPDKDARKTVKETFPYCLVYYPS